MVENDIGKCVEKLNNAQKKPLLTYPGLTGMHLGYLLKFSESLMKKAINRMVNRVVERIQESFACLAALREPIISSKYPQILLKSLRKEAW